MHHNAPTISHATRIAQTNHTYKELLRSHQFTPNSASTSQSPLKSRFDTFNLNEVDETSNKPSIQNRRDSKEDKDKLLKSEREKFLKKPIISEPKKTISGYHLFVNCTRKTAPHTIPTGLPQSKALSLLWQRLPQTEKDKWTEKANEEKIKYLHDKKIWSSYVDEAKRLGIAVPKKSHKAMLPPQKIKHLLALIPNLEKYDKETQFLIAKGTEMFIDFYASKAIEVSSKLSPSAKIEQLTISGQDCFDALESDHRFNFLRAVTVEPKAKPIKQKKKTKTKNKRGTKRKLNNERAKSSSIHSTASMISSSLSANVKNENNNDSVTMNDEIDENEEIISNKKRRLNVHNDDAEVANPYGFINSYMTTNGYYPQHPYIYNDSPFSLSRTATLPGQPNTMYQHPFYTPFYPNNNGINPSTPNQLSSPSNNTTQIIGEGQIFGED